MDYNKAHNKSLAESEDEKMIRRLKEIVKCVGSKNISHEDVELTDVLSWLNKLSAKMQYNRMAPIYDNIETFEQALKNAWNFYNNSGSKSVDSCEDDYIECVFSKGFREGFLYGSQTAPAQIK